MQCVTLYQMGKDRLQCRFRNLKHIFSYFFFEIIPLGFPIVLILSLPSFCADLQRRLYDGDFFLLLSPPKKILAYVLRYSTIRTPSTADKGCISVVDNKRFDIL